MKKFLSLVLALVMTMSLVTISAGAKEFADDDTITYDEAVAVISEIGVVDGYTDGKFNPTNTLTRQAAAKIICNLILGPTTAAELHADTAPYKDVPTTSEFAGYIAYCAKEGIISGYADGTFKPGNSLTGYAFMKMLLGALGYDANYEQYVGANWSINVAKQALGIGLNDTLVGEFNGIKAVTREEACLYAFNTLKSTMVAYDNKITASVNGAEVTISNTNAKPVTWKEGINEDGNIKADGFVQFAEEFFPKLVRKDDSTKFEEPANTWVFDKTEIGTFERKDLIVETYTEGVTGKDIYDLLKSGVIKDNDLEVYVDGIDALGSGTVSLSNNFEAITKFDKDDLVRSNDDDLGATGNGVVTKVYLDTDKDLITIVSINTWLAKATADYSESKEYAPLNVYNNRNNSVKPYNVDVVDVENVVDVTKDDFYLVNISWKDSNAGEVVILSEPEILEDSTVTKFSAKNGDTNSDTRYVTKLTTGGTEYKANVKAFYDKNVLDTYNDTLLTDHTYTVFLDANGYFAGVEEFEGTKNYVFITGFDRNSSNLSVKTATASGIFLDGTMQNIQVNVTDTDKNIDKAQTQQENGNYFKKWADTSWQTGRGFDGVYNLNQWYTYTVDADGTYTLKPCARMTKTRFLPDAAHAVEGYDVDNKVDTIRTDALSVVDDLTPNNRVYGEDETVFLTVSLDIVDTTSGIKKAITEVEGVYTGVQNVDIDIDVEDPEAIGQSQVFTVYDSDYYVIAAVVIGEARGSTANYAYITSGAKSEEKIDDTYYWEFEAVLNGEHQTLTAKSKYHNTIESLTKGTVQELRFDGDYVVSIKDVDKVYTDYRFQIDDEDVYAMRDELTVNTQAVNATPAVKGIVDDPDTLFLQGRTLYITSNRADVGLGLAAGAKAVTIQKENGSTEETNFSDVASAIAHLADADEATAGFQYDGKVYAVLNSNGTADWIVFVNDTELLTGTQTPSYGYTGNLLTVYNAKQTVSGLTLAGSSATGTFNLLGYGVLQTSVTYTAPAWVPDGAQVTLTAPILYNNMVVGSFTGTGVISGGKALLNQTSPFGNYLAYENANNFSFGNATAETFSAVNVYYFDQTGARLESKLDMNNTSKTLTTNALAQEALKIKMVNSDAVNDAVLTIAGTSSDTSASNISYATLNTGWTAGTNRNAIGNGPVVVTLNVASLANTYKVEKGSGLATDVANAIDLTGGSATAATMDKFGLASNDDTLKIETTANVTSGLNQYNVVTFKATVANGADSAPAAATYKVTVTTTAGTLTFTGLSTTANATLTMPAGDVTITGVKAEVETPLVVVNTVTKTADNQITVKFNTAVNDGTSPVAAALAAADFTLGTGTIVDVAHTVDTNTVVITVDHVLTVGETVTINASSVYNTANSADVLTGVTAYTLGANGLFV